MKPVSKETFGKEFENKTVVFISDRRTYDDLDLRKKKLNTPEYIFIIKDIINYSKGRNTSHGKVGQPRNCNVLEFVDCGIYKDSNLESLQYKRHLPSNQNDDYNCYIDLINFSIKRGWKVMVYDSTFDIGASIRGLVDNETNVINQLLDQKSIILRSSYNDYEESSKKSYRNHYLKNGELNQTTYVYQKIRYFFSTCRYSSNRSFEINSKKDEGISAWSFLSESGTYNHYKYAYKLSIKQIGEIHKINLKLIEVYSNINKKTRVVISDYATELRNISVKAA
jgi:hypothetical protein